MKHTLRKKTGPKEGRIKIEGNWQNAMKKALSVKRPEEGWPEPDGKVRRKRSAPKKK